MRVRVVLCLVGALAVLGGGVAAVAQDKAAEPVRISNGRFSINGGGDSQAIAPAPAPAFPGFMAGQAVVPQLDAFASPNPAPGTAPVHSAPNPTHEGFPLVVSVIDGTPDGQWLKVRMPKRPNGSEGWVRAADLSGWYVPNRVIVDLSDRRLVVVRGLTDDVLFDTRVAVGRPGTPTPTGSFHVDIVNYLGNDRTYGWGQLSVSGFSNVHERFAGGIGQIAIHGWNNPSVMGTAASNGCIRMTNGDIARLADLAPLGTPVHIHE